MRDAARHWLVPGILVMAGACAPGPPAPVAIDTSVDACAHCRMSIVSTATAAQIVEPGAEAVLFDDLGCLRAYVERAGLAPDARVFVADHRTGEWVDGRTAVFTKTSLETPMGSGLVAHATTASRDLDSAAAHGAAVSRRSVLP